MDGREPSEVEHAYVSDESHRFGRRNNDALALRDQGKYEEAEAAFRAIEEFRGLR